MSPDAKQNPPPQVRWAVVLGSVAALTVAILYLRSGSEPELAPAPPTFAPEARERGQEAMRRRLQDLREAHERRAGSGSSASRGASGAERAEAPSGGTMDVSRGEVRGGGEMQRLKPRPGGMGQAPEAAEVPADVDLDVDPDDIASLKQIALQDPDPDRRLTAVTLLGASDSPEAIPILGEALKDADEEVRLAAIQSLADMTDAAPVDLLGTAALADPSPDNRYEALEALADLGGPAARAYLEKALQDPDQDVAALAESLLELDSDESEMPSSGAEAKGR